MLINYAYRNVLYIDHNTKTRRYKQLSIAHNSLFPQSLASGRECETARISSKYMMCFFVLMLRYREPQSRYHHEHLIYNKWCHGSCGELRCHLMCWWGDVVGNGLNHRSLAGNPESSKFSIKVWSDFKPLEHSSICYVSNWKKTLPILHVPTLSVSKCYKV